MLMQLPYGKTHLTHEVPDARVQGVLVSKIEDYKPELSQEELVAHALDHPIGTPKLEEMAKGKQKVVILCSDHTRPVPSRIIIPQMLQRIRKGNPDADITLLIATGCHRATTKAELNGKFGDEIMQNEKIYVHDCEDHDMIVSIGTLPSGGEITVNRIAREADLLVSEGFIEPHFFAGYSGGRKSVFPGCCSRETVMYNHNAEFIDSPLARTGVLKGNPIHRDMVAAARQLQLVFICNVIINAHKHVIHAVAGDLEEAHEAGVHFLNNYCMVPKVEADIAITSNGGYPLDQNIYQAVKSMTAAEACVKQDGVIIVASESSDGVGGEGFYRTFKEEPSEQKLMDSFLATPKHLTIADQWQSQIFARVLMKARVIFISQVADDIVKDLHMIPAHSLEEALQKAEQLLNNPDATITLIPDGVAVIVNQQA